MKRIIRQLAATCTAVTAAALVAVAAFAAAPATTDAANAPTFSRDIAPILQERCQACHGQGVAPRTESIAVSIPAGVADGARLRVAGKGHAGVRGGPPGDLFLDVHVEPHPVFRREGDDIHMVLPIAIHEAGLGAKLDVTLPNGTFPLAPLVAALILGGGTFILAWIGLGMMLTGAKIVSWTQGDREAVKRILEYSLGRRRGEG